MKLEIDIIEISNKVVFKRKILLSTLLFYPIIGIIVQPNPESLLNIGLASLFILDLIINIYYRNKIKRYNVINKLHLNEEMIQFNDRQIKLLELKCIGFEYSGFKGEFYPAAPFGRSIFGTKDGAGNEISFKTFDNKQFNLKLLLISEFHYRNLRKILNLYRKLGVDVTWNALRISK